ncbi:hypothetical protein RCL1_007940 [Eukaryota sp. TZLM3-RCL]
MIAFNDQLQVFASHLGFNRNDTLNLYNGLLYPMIDAHFDNFFGQAILLTIFPRTINNKDGTTETVERLLEAVHKNPQQFLRPALLLSVEIEELGGSPYVVTPLTTNNVPGFCTIDTRTLVAIINVKANQQERRLMNKYEQVKKFSTEEQLSYWSQFMDMDTKPFRKKYHKFNNIIHTDGISVTLEFCRNDEVGKRCVEKGDTGYLKETDVYFTQEKTRLTQNKNIVVCDPGKRDMLHFCSKKEQPNVPIFEDEEELEKPPKKTKEYTWHRLTYPEWTRVSRVHQQQQMTSRKSFGVEEVESSLSKYSSKAATFIDFSLYVVEKTNVTKHNEWFYLMDLWRIQKMQNYCYRQKIESQLKQALVHKYTTQDSFGRIQSPVIMFGDFSVQGGSSKNLRNNPPSKGSAWRRTLQKLGFPVFLINEWGTSSRCPDCQGSVDKFLDVANPKPYRRGRKPTTLCHGLLSCVSEECKGKGERKYWNRNKLACINMLEIVRCIRLGQDRPLYLSSL